MDVGNPSNVERMRWLFHDDVDAIRAAVQPSVHTDAEVRGAIAELWNDCGYIADPHTAIAYLGTKQMSDGRPRVLLATAHPAKFGDVVEPIVGRTVPLPPALAEAMSKPRQARPIEPHLRALVELL
jgi:threonine synthase